MTQLQRILRGALPALVAAAVLLACEAALACPTCKDNMAADPDAANLARGYYYSILFMLSMPPLILGGLSAYFYWEIRKARLRQANLANASG